MSNPNQYSHRISILFNEYIQGQLNTNQLIQKLRVIEAKYKENVKDVNSPNAIWFKFSQDDTLVTTIDDLAKDLSDDNRDFTLERIREALNLDQELFVHYS